MCPVIIYLCDSYFPRGRAYSSRVLNLCRLFCFVGYRVFVIADYSFDSSDKGVYTSIESINYVVLGEENRKYNYLTKYSVSLDEIDRLIDSFSEESIYLIISAGDCTRYKKIKNKYRRYTNIHLIIECCEWYDRSSYLLSELDPRFLLFKYRMNNDYLSENSFIVISRLLQNHFSAQGKTVVRIPTVLKTSEIPFAYETNNTKTRIMFAGSLGGDKELFTEFLFALSNQEVRNHFEFHIYGGTEKDLAKCLGPDSGVLHQLLGIVFCHGFLQQELIEEEYAKSDFSIIFRPNRKSSHAGFPTKLAESMATGTPVIANDTGDIGLYINDKKNGFIVDYNRDEILKCLSYIKTMTYNNKRMMRRAARLTAVNSFDYINYTDEIEQLFQK